MLTLRCCRVPLIVNCHPELVLISRCRSCLLRLVLILLCLCRAVLSFTPLQPLPINKQPLSVQLQASPGCPVLLFAWLEPSARTGLRRPFHSRRSRCSTRCRIVLLLTAFASSRSHCIGTIMNERQRRTLLVSRVPCRRQELTHSTRCESGYVTLDQYRHVVSWIAFGCPCLPSASLLCVILAASRATSLNGF